jgi:hypothetical protein
MARRLLVPPLVVLLAALAGANSGTESAAFLDIPVGAGPASMGSAYTALAQDAYAPTVNPAGLGFLTSTQFSGQHLAYINSNHYEYLSAVHPLRPGRGVGVAVQYFGTGKIAATDVDGNPAGTFDSQDAAYSAAYGQALGENLSLGVAAKYIRAQIAGFSAGTGAADLGAVYKIDRRLTLAAAMQNVGGKLSFLSESDPLPSAFHVAVAYRPSLRWTVALEGVYARTGLASGHLGLEWRPVERISLRTGYRTDTVKGLSALAGYTAGLGLHFLRHEIAYAWVPLGELGDTHYLSLIVRFGGEDGEEQVIDFREIKSYRAASGHEADASREEIDQLMELLRDDSDPRLSQRTAGH